MEQKFGKNSIDIEALREFCEREGEAVAYYKGDQLEREGDPARWFGFVTEGCFKYVTYGISDDKAPIKLEPSSSLGHLLSQARACATSTSTAPQPANAMSCCCSVALVLLSILPCRTSPRSSVSPLII